MLLTSPAGMVTVTRSDLDAAAGMLDMQMNMILSTT